jgi:hypothetical protein
MYPTTMTLLVYSVFRHVHTNSEKVYWLRHVCLSICQHISQRLALDGFSSNLIVVALWQFVHLLQIWLE